MRVKKYFLSSLLILLSCFAQQISHAQCATPINSFPYDQDFETTDGGWVTGSSSATVLSDWEWGAPVASAKTVITNAASGTKCWIAGGLSKSSYNDGERSWLQSPCFDISSLSNPEVSFKAFWETEKKYDGATFQFSTDGGATFITLGDINSNSDCTGQNWFNYDPVFFLSGPGWSGNIQATSGSCLGGGGSGGWLASRHSLFTVAGATSIIFRFKFAAGLTCNNFDGFAIDDFSIHEAAPNSADFTFTCNANSKVDFGSTAQGCKSGVSWDFGDILSGTTNNSSTLDNPSHTFSSAGNYTVTLTTYFLTGPSVAVAKNISIINATTTITNDIKCEGDKTGALTVTVNPPPPGAYNYSWDTNPIQVTPSISNLGIGTYTVTITGTNVCSISLPVILTGPGKLIVSPVIGNATCNQNNGIITTMVSGGTSPYTYLWSNSAITPAIQDLPPATYSFTVTDANGCSVSPTNLVVKNIDNTVTPVLGSDRPICPDQTIILDPGNFASYKWQDNAVSSTYSVTTAGTYSVTVTDNLGCTGFASVKITKGTCVDIFFPSAFTPNGDTNNEEFGPLPVDALAAVKNYKLTVYGRWGEVIFTSKDPYKKWDGKYKGKILPTQTVTWTATYTIGNFEPSFQKGTLTIIR